MAKYTINLSANTTGMYVCHVKKPHTLLKWEASLTGYGTYGGGTLAWFMTPDAGATLIALTDLVDTAVSMTTNKVYNAALCTGAKNNDQLQIWVTLSGATTPSLTVTAYDNH